MGIFKARARKTDPVTSHEAAATISEPVTHSRMKMVELLLQAQSMDDETLVDLFHSSAAIGLCKMASPQGIRSARANLVKDGKVQAVDGVFTKTRMGNNAHVWEWVG